ncbi:iron-containing alcohol dehydrogenase [Carboxylicivirga sp. A043]|uniref:iron-containing alcohol dehydrogenase n=1 Tax=Carboxylicivirga litoralis TaxID=2816963 RepID=UPI0021CB96DF|nr:iron-containing alcohol dehydrogenase [Carboxylicivirga sp. A043]MCU4155655.1 iron-containing alcohol dehydrogenase [Carboxylicivirga sp. A043]
MLNFDFYNPTHIVFGKERLNELDKLVPQNAKVLITYGGGSVKKFGTLPKVTEALKGREVLEFGGIEPNPRFETLMNAVDVVKKENIDFLLAVGGGSVMDGTKFIALAANYKGNDPEKILMGGAGTVEEAVPLGTVVTLPATGSEMNMGGVVTYNGGKLVFMSPLAFPKFSFLDPTLTYSLPKKQVANGVVDAFVHTTEQYLTFPVDGRFQDRTAEGILQSLIEIGRKTMDEPEDYDTRANLVWNATMALNGVIGSGVPQDWATHMLGHEITAFYGVDHGQSLAIVLPSLLRLRKEGKKAKLIQYAERVWNITTGTDDEKMEQAITKTEEFFNSLDVKTKLSDYGIDASGIDLMIGGLEAKGLKALSETRDITLDVSRQIYEAAL